MDRLPWTTTASLESRQRGAIKGLQKYRPQSIKSSARQRSDVGRGKQIASRTRRKDGPMTTKTSETIIEVAALRHKIDHPSDDDVRPNDLNTLKLKLASLEAGDVGLVEMVGKLMNGMRYSLSSDNPESIRRHTEVALAFGAKVEETALLPGLTSILITPPSHPVQ
jgi:hypothetical protein